MARSYVAYLLFSFVGSLQACDNNWVPFRGHCYLFFTSEQKSWFQAKEMCTARGSSLVSIETSEENDWLIMQLIAFSGGKGYQAYIGNNDLVRKSAWKWEATNEQIWFKDWGPGEPHGFNNGKDERCAMITFVNSKYYGWADVPCESPREALICEKKDYPDCSTK